MTEKEEQAYVNGSRASHRRMIDYCIMNLGKQDMTKEQAIEELEGARGALRSLCAEVGDNDWDDRLHLADVIDKHLGRHLIG